MYARLYAKGIGVTIVLIGVGGVPWERSRSSVF
jgi:hypothetical protein